MKKNICGIKFELVDEDFETSEGSLPFIGILPMPLVPCEANESTMYFAIAQVLAQHNLIKLDDKGFRKVLIDENGIMENLASKEDLC